jgi:hypothetical protein
MNAINHSSIQEVCSTDNVDDANKLIEKGWKLLGVFQRQDSYPEAWTSYVLGMATPEAETRLSKVVEVEEDEANRLLDAGWEYLLTIKRKADDGGEYPCFIVGRRSSR